MDQSSTPSSLVPAPTAGSPAVPVPGPPKPTRVSGFFTGVGYMARGFGMYRRYPGVMILGLVPALISFVALVAAFIAMVFLVDDVVRLLTPYMQTWPDLVREGARWVAMGAVAIVWVMLSIFGYVAVTLAIGQPFYEAISKRVEDRLGGVPGEINVSFWRSLPRMIMESVRTGVPAAVLGVGLFLIGLIPVVGFVAFLVLGSRLMGWVIAIQVTSVPFERRALRYRDRKQVLRANKSMTLGFGAAAFLCTVIPLSSIVSMPAAVAGATLMARRILQPDA